LDEWVRYWYQGELLPLPAELLEQRDANWRRAEEAVRKAEGVSRQSEDAKRQAEDLQRRLKEAEQEIARLKARNHGGGPVKDA